MKVIIVGDGIGGTATALALNQVELEPIVYERTRELRESDYLLVKALLI